MVKFEGLKPKEQQIVEAISKRAQKLYKTKDRIGFMMDITACHLNGNPLRLKDLLKADDANFTHDITGINQNLNHDTGKIDNFFLPRFTASKTKKH